MNRRGIWLLLTALGCGGSKDEPTPTQTGGTIAHFELPSGALKWGEVPFPSDLYLGDDGTVDLASAPPSVDGEPIWAKIVEDVGLRKGFCTTCNTYFAIEGELDRTQPDGAIVMVDADGKAVPTQYEWNGDDKVLAVRPVPWIILKRNSKYVVALTSKARDKSGAALRASQTFAALRDGGGDARGKKVIGPAFELLAKASINKGDVVSIAAFTTEDPTADAVQARKLVYAAGKPTVTVDKVFPDDAALDEVFGVPADDTPGLTDAKNTSIGKTAMTHDQIGTLVYGSFASPHVRAGAPEVGGFPVRSGGVLGAMGEERVRFALAIPKGATLSKLPVVVVLTGYSSDLHFGLAPANAFARAGAATLALDPPCQGGRGKGATDTTSRLRGFPVPDGILESNNNDGIFRCLGVIDAPAGTKAHPEYMAGFNLQSATDLFAAIRLLKEGDVSPIAKDALATLAFDPKNVFVLGNHGGNLASMAVAAIEPDLAGVMFNAFVSSMAETFGEGPGITRFSASQVFTPLAIQQNLDESIRRYAYHPAIDMVRWIWEAGDARTFYPYVYKQPIASGARPDLFIQRPELDDAATEEQIGSACVALGIPMPRAQLGAPVDVKAPPYSANVMGSSAGALVIPNAGAHVLFFAHDDSAYEPPFNPPAKLRPKPITLDNPRAVAHAQLETFVKTHLASGHAEIK
jgi:hypothetical protein